MIEGRFADKGGWKRHPAYAVSINIKAAQIELGDAKLVSRWVGHLHRNLSRRRRSYRMVASTSGAAPRREDQSRPGARRRPAARQGHRARAGQVRGRALELARRAADAADRQNDGVSQVGVLRVNEARDVGESGRIDRYGLYDTARTSWRRRRPPYVSTRSTSGSTTSRT